jgi:hypothetical protein
MAKKKGKDCECKIERILWWSVVLVVGGLMFLSPDVVSHDVLLGGFVVVMLGLTIMASVRRVTPNKTVVVLGLIALVFVVDHYLGFALPAQAFILISLIIITVCHLMSLHKH